MYRSQNQSIMETNLNQQGNQASVQEVDLDIDSWLGAPGADAIVTPNSGDDKEDEPAKNNIFSKNETDLSFLDGEEGSAEGEEKAPTGKEIISDIIDADINQDEEEFEDPTPAKGGRPKTEKSGLVNFLKKRIESKEMFAFDDYDETKQDLDDYLSSLSEKDVDELWEANISNMKQEVAAQTPAEFFDSLPEELQYALVKSLINMNEYANKVIKKKDPQNSTYSYINLPTEQYQLIWHWSTKTNWDMKKMVQKLSI